MSEKKQYIASIQWQENKDSSYIIHHGARWCIAKSEQEAIGAMYTHIKTKHPESTNPNISCQEIHIINGLIKAKPDPNENQLPEE